MEPSNWIALGALAISSLSYVQSTRAKYGNDISEMKRELSEAADKCNKFIIPGTLGHTDINQELSDIFTTINEVENQLKIFFNKHAVLKLGYLRKELIHYFYKKLHTSNRELIKNDLRISNYDPFTSPKVIDRHKNCRIFFSVVDKSIIPYRSNK